MSNPIGIILSGSLSEGLLMRISEHEATNRIKSGRFVSIKSNDETFFSLVTDIKLSITHPDIPLAPPALHEQLLMHAIKDRFLSLHATLRPLLMLDKNGKRRPVKTVPHHFSPVYEATDDEVALIFGRESDGSGRYFNLGSPLDMSAEVCINLDALTERSTGIFGKTGTGKTFLTRLVLAGLIKQNKALSIIFDMHSEYGSQARREGSTSSFVKGLKTLFPDKVAIFSLDPESTRKRGGKVDVAVTIPYRALQVQDIVSLQEELNLHPTAYEAAYLLENVFKKEWLHQLLTYQGELKELADRIGAHPESIIALHRKLKCIERFPFITPEKAVGGHDVVEELVSYIDKGYSVIIEFGNFTSTLCYLLVANIITRRIHTLYTKKTELFLGSQRAEDEPRKLIIAVEEAHKFLNPAAARQTIFGTIAREMRKYYVSLLVVDQRPSGIDSEVLSQIGTKIIAQLHDEKDIVAVLGGMPNSSELRTILSSLDSKKQVLLAGHAVPMPLVIEPRTYDETFYASLITQPQKDILEQTIKDLF